MSSGPRGEPLASGSETQTHELRPTAETPTAAGRTTNQPKVFAFDHCFWSIDESQKDRFAGQDVVFRSLGESLLDNAFMGYNACIFAYGQTGNFKPADTHMYGPLLMSIHGSMTESLPSY
ncbi:Kinesin-like protein KIF13B [Liparis tanakae]|uniref:Kinesin-like protein KIF13B n=1 Tax=Liparis tanakae TaxID=230148 RepID=A0A4Z2ERL0_9TELE|nr:Kinesin-like protein KIF13B [Liparis tanakae]